MIIPLDGVHLKIDKRNNNYIQHLTSQKKQLYAASYKSETTIICSILQVRNNNYIQFWNQDEGVF